MKRQHTILSDASPQNTTQEAPCARWGPVFRQQRIQGEIDEQSTATAYGGLALFHTLVQRLGLPEEINRHLTLLKLPSPYWESDHVLTHAYNLLCGGECIEDIANLQSNEAVRRMLGTDRIPDPTTAGDFLRRFGPAALKSLQRAIDAVRVRVWKKLPKEKRRRATIDVDSHIREVYGVCKEGADFSYTGKWSYHPLEATLAETGEWLRVINRPGSASSQEGAVEMMRECLKLTQPHFREVFWRGDSAFYLADLINLSQDRGAHFVVSVDTMANLVARAQALSEAAWRPMAWDTDRPACPRAQQRRKRTRCRDEKVRERGYRDLQAQEQWVAEFPYRPSGCHREYRMVVRRVRIRESQGQQVLWEGYRYRFMLTDVRAWSPERVVRFGYGRCDIENDIEQQENGIAAMKMPTGELNANGAFALMAELSWNLKAWAAQLVLPEEVARWEWKRFRHAFIYLGAKVVRRARQVVARMAGAHRHVQELWRALNRAANLRMT